MLPVGIPGTNMFNQFIAQPLPWKVLLEALDQNLDFFESSLTGSCLLSCKPLVTHSHSFR